VAWAGPVEGERRAAKGRGGSNGAWLDGWMEATERGEHPVDQESLGGGERLDRQWIKKASAQHADVLAKR